MTTGSVLAIGASIAIYVARVNSITNPYQIQYLFAIACVFAMLDLSQRIREWYRRNMP